MKLSYASRVILFTILAFLVGIPLGLRYGRRGSLMRRSERIASKIETFRSQHQKLPSTLEEVDKEENEIFYQRDGDTNYILWFGNGLGESITYHSSNRTWHP